jgi:hypothetical protein
MSNGWRKTRAWATSITPVGNCATRDRAARALIAAQRDALDDRTASIVAREITEAFSRDRHIAAGMLETAHSQFNAR